MIDCLRSFCLVKLTGFVHLASLDLVSTMVHYVTVNTDELVGRSGMHNTGCSGGTQLVRHIPTV